MIKVRIVYTSGEDYNTDMIDAPLVASFVKIMLVETWVSHAEITAPDWKCIVRPKR